MLDEYELFDSLANKALRTHKAMLIVQGFNHETADLETFMEHCERTETTDKLHQETVLNLNLVMNHVDAYFGPKECPSKEKR